MFPCICVRIFVPRCHILLLYALSRRLWPLLMIRWDKWRQPNATVRSTRRRTFFIIFERENGANSGAFVVDRDSQFNSTMVFYILFGILFFLRLELFLSLLRERRRLRPNDWNSGAERQLNNTKKKGGNWRRRDWHTVAKNKRRACPPHFLFSVFCKRVHRLMKKKKNYFERAAPKH